MSSLFITEDSDCVLAPLDLDIDGGEFVRDFVSRNLKDESSEVGVVNENENGDLGVVSPPPPSNKFSDDLDLLVLPSPSEPLLPVTPFFLGMAENEKVLNGGSVVSD